MDNNTIFNSYVLNSTIVLKNRIIMAPISRHNTHDDFSPHETMASYYAKRADAGLIISEGTLIHADNSVIRKNPGIFTNAHIQAWKKITDKIHEQNGLIFLQLWHPGKISDIQAQDLQSLVKHFAIAASNALKAGFDGIEIHGGNGYLFDQFLHYNTNQRIDHYGGTPTHMTRLLLDIINACNNEINSEHIGLRLSPGCYTNRIIGDTRDKEVFIYLLQQLNHLSLAYIHTGANDDKIIFPELNNITMTKFMRAHYIGNLIACGSYDLIEAKNGIEKNNFDLVAMGRPFIANPDLIFRLKNQLPLKDYDTNMLNVLE